MISKSIKEKVLSRLESFKRKRLSEVEVTRMCTLFANGEPVESIAKDIGCSVYTVHKKLREAVQK